MQDGVESKTVKKLGKGISIDANTIWCSERPSDIRVSAELKNGYAK